MDEDISFESLSPPLQDWINEHITEKFRNNSALYKALPDALRPPGVMKEPLYNIFKQRKREFTNRRKHLAPAQEAGVDIDGTLDYPFRSKLTAYADKHDIDGLQASDYVKDYNIKNLPKKYKRPNYSPIPYSYEMDIMFAQGDGHQELVLYLVLININTRFLIVRSIRNKSGEEIRAVLDDIKHTTRIDSIKGDGESGFSDSKTQSIIEQRKGETCIFDGSPYTFHNKHVDSVIRTIRNAAGLSYDILRNNNYVQQIVNFYNDTPHSGLPVDANGIHYTPNEMQNNIDLEWQYIRQKDSELNDAYKEIHEAGLDKYKPGNILLIHLDRGKTNRSMEKRRRNFEDIGEFIKYEHGNVMCRHITGRAGDKNIITVPIFYTKKIAKDYDTLAEKYKKLFNI